jgi:putative Mg2+ transporter-C (MgtC) family protein
MITTEIFFRLVVATLCGIAIGFNRDSKDKPAGMRTLGLASLAAALAATAATSLPELAGHPDAISRVTQGVFQGVLTGVGFIGAGVVLHQGGDRPNVHGVTTAATVWLAAVLGLACGFGAWPIALAGLCLAFVVLVVAKPAERWILARLGQPQRPAADDVAPRDRRPGDGRPDERRGD